VDNLPLIANLELTNRCNIACKFCAHKSMKRRPADMDKELYTEGLTYEWYIHVKDEMEKILLTEDYPSVVEGLGTGSLKVRVLEDNTQHTYTCVVVNHLNGEKAACDWTEALSFAVQ
jgi:molybdenum cofactor biosynthesis enzyme MoaA